MLGVRAGTTWRCHHPNVPWFPIAYFGILKCGAAVVPLNVLLKPREIAYHLKDSGAKALVAFEGTADLPIGAMCEQAAGEAHTPHVFVLPRDAATLLRDPAGFHPPRREPHDTAVILYTSGTPASQVGRSCRTATCSARHSAMLSAVVDSGTVHKLLITSRNFHSPRRPRR